MRALKSPPIQKKKKKTTTKNKQTKKTYNDFKKFLCASQ